MATYISQQRAGVGWGFSRVCLTTLSLFGDTADSDDGARARGHLVVLCFPLTSLVCWSFGSKSGQLFIASTTGHRPLGVDNLDLDVL